VVDSNYENKLRMRPNPSNFPSERLSWETEMELTFMW
jgi:hypothetical protein